MGRLGGGDPVEDSPRTQHFTPGRIAPMIHVIATIEVSPKGRDDFLKEFHRIVPEVLAEEGCISYGPTVDVETGIPAQGELRANVVTIVEQWESLEHLQRHLEAPHMLAYRERVKDLVQGVSLQVLQPA